MRKIPPLTASFFMTLMLATAILSGCASGPQPTPVPGLSETLAVRTMVALRGVEYFATYTPTSYPTPTAPIFQNQQASHFSLPATATPVPSLTPIVPGGYQNVDSLVYTGKCLNEAEFIKDVTCEDATPMKGGEKFTKVWLLRNTGTCTWTANYLLVFTLGDKMSGESPKPIGKEVKPGETLEISVDLVAPKEPDYYQGNWMLQDEEGNLFGTGFGKRNFFWVSIVVGGNGGIPRMFGGCRGGG
jgi:Ig-like domain from next to BRCA1 gene